MKTKPNSPNKPAAQLPKPAAAPTNQAEDWHAKHDRKRAELAAHLVLSDLDDDERAALAAFQQLYRGNRGCTTPFEEFIWSLIGRTENGHSPTPDDVRRELETFEENWKDMRRDAARFLSQYPGTSKPESEAA